MRNKDEVQAILVSVMQSIGKNSDYKVCDITAEAWREVLVDGKVICRIENPIALVFRKGGSTHRVVAEDDSVYCYAAPETGKSVVRWGNKPDYPPIQF